MNQPARQDRPWHIHGNFMMALILPMDCWILKLPVIPHIHFLPEVRNLVRLIVGDNNAVGGCNAIVEKIVNVTPTSIAQISASNTKFCKITWFFRNISSYV